MLCKQDSTCAKSALCRCPHPRPRSDFRAQYLFHRSNFDTGSLSGFVIAFLKWRDRNTESGIKACTWLREISSCSCLTVLPSPAWLLLNKMCIPLFRALYICQRHHFHPAGRRRTKVWLVDRCKCEWCVPIYKGGDGETFPRSDAVFSSVCIAAYVHYSTNHL